MKKKSINKKKDKPDTQHLIQALPYVVWPVGVILLVIEETKAIKEQNTSLRHHAYNALGFAIGAFLLSIPVWILEPLPFFGNVIAVLYWIGIITLAFVFAHRAYHNKEVNVPIMTTFLQKNIKRF